MHLTWTYAAGQLTALGADNQPILRLSAQPQLGACTAVAFNAHPRLGELVLRGFLGELPAPAAIHASGGQPGQHTTPAP